MNMNNVIIIRSVYGRVGQVYYIQPHPNPKTGKYPPCVKTVDSNGDMILSEDEIRRMNAGEVHFIPASQVFEIVDGTSFDLDDIVDKAKWESIEHCNWIAKDRYQKDINGDYIIDGGAKRYGVANLYVERVGEFTKLRVDKKKLIHKASSYIYEDPELERVKKARVLGRNLTNAMPADVLDFLIEIAEKNPRKIIDLYESEDWKMQLFIIEAVEKGVIRKSDGIYKYDDKILGGSVESVIQLLRDIQYKKILDSIKRETYPHLAPKSTIENLQNSLLDDTPYSNVSDPKGPNSSESTITPPPGASSGKTTTKK